MKKRNPGLVILFILLSFSIYLFIYLYKTSKELNEALRSDIQPSIDFVLLIMGFIPYIVYVPYRNQTRIDEWHHRRSSTYKPRANILGLFLGAPFVAGFVFSAITMLLKIGPENGRIMMQTYSAIILSGWAIAIYLYQVELNTFSDAQKSIEYGVHSE